MVGNWGRGRHGAGFRGVDGPVRVAARLAGRRRPYRRPPLESLQITPRRRSRSRRRRPLRRHQDGARRRCRAHRRPSHRRRRRTKQRLQNCVLSDVYVYAQRYNRSRGTLPHGLRARGASPSLCPQPPWWSAGTTGATTPSQCRPPPPCRTRLWFIASRAESRSRP